jgi:hypothetical protein
MAHVDFSGLPVSFARKDSCAQRVLAAYPDTPPRLPLWATFTPCRAIAAWLNNIIDGLRQQSKKFSIVVCCCNNQLLIVNC